VETWNFAQPAEQDKRVAALAGTDPKDVYGSGHNALYANYIGAVNSDTQPLVSGREGIKAMKIVLAAYKSQKTKQAVDFDSLEFAATDMADGDVHYRRP
jgi:predicted dehydrogenase